MSTKGPLSNHESEGGKPSWRLYEELFEAGVVYLELEGVPVDFTNMEHGPGIVLLRLPIETAQQLGLHTTVSPERWKEASDSDK